MKRSVSLTAIGYRLRGQLCVLFLLPVVSFSTASAEAAEAEITIRANIIGFEDAKIMCRSAEPPAWCPDHLRRDADLYDRKKVQLLEQRKELMAQRLRAQRAVRALPPDHNERVRSTVHNRPEKARVMAAR